MSDIVTCDWPGASCGVRDEDVNMNRGSWIPTAEKPLGKVYWQCDSCRLVGVGIPLFKNGGTL